MSEEDRWIMAFLERELEKTRKKREEAIGYDMYRHFWEKEKRLEKLIARLKGEG